MLSQTHRIDRIICFAATFIILFYSLGNAQSVRCYTPQQHLIPGVSVQIDGEEGTTQTLRPQKKDGLQTGLNAFDLHRIFAHISGEKPFNTPFEILASDLNTSGSTTTFDVVELRKLILGQYDATKNPWPYDVWRFIPQSHIWSDTLYPGDQHVPDAETGVFTAETAPVLFWGVKLGDLDFSAYGPAVIPSERANISWPQFPIPREGYALIPITYNGTPPLVTLQLGFRYDTNMLQLITPLPNDDLPTDEKSFFMPQNGKIRHVWMSFSPEIGNAALHSGNCLFYLMFKIKGNLPASGLPLYLDDTVMSNMGWTAEGAAHPLEWYPKMAQNDIAETRSQDLQVRVSPYVSSGETNFTMTTSLASEARLFIFNAHGVLIDRKELDLQAGTQTLRVQEQTLMPAGVYKWKVVTRKIVQSGYFIRE